jgi:hypothetical protein
MTTKQKFWLHPQVRVAYNDGYDVHTLRELLEIVEGQQGSYRKSLE